MMQTSGNIGIARKVYRKKLLPRVHVFQDGTENLSIKNLPDRLKDIRDLMLGRVPVHGTDTVPAMLTPGEAVLTPGAAEMIGRDRIRRLNEISRKFAGNDRNDLLKDTEDTFYGGGQVPPPPSPTPSPTPVGRLAKRRAFMPPGVLMAQGGVERVYDEFGRPMDRDATPGWWTTGSGQGPQGGELGGEWSDPSIEPSPIPYVGEGSPSTVASGSDVPPPPGAGGLVSPPDVPSIPYQLPNLPPWVKFIPGGQYAIAGRNLFNLGSRAGSMAKNLFRNRGGGTPGVQAPPVNRADAGGYFSPEYLRSIGYEPGQGVGSLWPGVPQGGFGGGGISGQGGSFFGQLSGVRGGPLPGSFAGLGAGGGGALGSMGGLIFQHMPLAALGGLNVLQAQRAGMLPNQNFSLAGVREFAGRVQPRAQ